MNEVAEIEYRGDYVHHVVFDDGLSRNVNLSEYLSKGPIFEPPKHKTLFQSARAEGGTISWPNGADIAPETLYEKISKTA